MNLFIVILVIAVISVAMLYFASKNAHEIKEEPKPHQVRKVTFVTADTEKPKRKKKKYYNKKKKPVVSENAPTEKRPVGRPRKVTE